MSDVSMRILLSSTGGGAVVGAVQGIGRSLSSLPGIMGPIATASLAVGAALVGIGVVSTKMAADYQSAMTQLQNTTNSSDADMTKYKATIRSLSDETGKAQTDLAKGMYQIVSANFSGADATRILATATRASIIANADQTQVTTGLVVTLNAFNLKASQADTVSNQMFKTLSLGRGNMSDLAGALQTGAALVAHYGVSVTDMDATLATLSTGGMKTFGVAMTATTQLLNIMDGKTDLITGRMHKLGISFDETKFKAMDYQHQIAYLNEALKGHEKQMVSVFGSKQAATALGILGTQTNLLAKSTKALSNTQELAKEKQTAWSNVQGTFNFQMQKVLTTVNNLMIDVGSKLLPIFTKVAIAVIPLIQHFGDWLIKSGALDTAASLLATGIKNLIGTITTLVGWGVQVVSFFKSNEVAMDALKSVLIAFALVVAPLVVMALGSMAIAAWAAITPLLPFVLAIAVLALAVFGIIELMKNWGNIMDWLTGKTKQSMLEQGEARERARIKAINEQKLQKEGVLKHLEDERTEAMNKLKTMAAGYAKNREEMRLAAINNQIATTKGDINELNKEKAQHLKALQDLLNQDPQYRERTKIAAINKQREQKIGVLQELEDEKKQLLEKLADEKNASDRARDQMKLNAVNKQIATTNGTLKELDREKTQHATKLNQLVSSDLEARKNWYDRANDAVTAWFASWSGSLSRAIGGWMSALGTWVHNSLGSLNTMVQGWGVGLQKWGNDTLAAIGRTVGGWFSSLGAWVHGTLANFATMVGGWFSALGTWVSNTLATIGRLPGQAASALGGLAGSLVGTIQNAGAAAVGAALSAGASIVNGIANGIMGAIGSVTSAIGNVVGIIDAHLPHSPAKVGPLSQLNEYGPALVNTFAQGILNSSPVAWGAIHALTSGIASGLASTGGSSGVGAISTGRSGDSGVLADQLSFTTATTDIYRGRRKPVDSRAEKKREANQYKSSEKAVADDFKAIDAEIAAIKKREAAKIKHDRAAYAAEIKAIETRDKHFRGSAKKAEEAQIKAIRAQEKRQIANERRVFEARIKADRAKEKQLRQEIKLELHIHADSVAGEQEMQRIAEYTLRHFSEQIRAQFANL